MADPASILGLISASLTIAIRAATIGKDLHSLTTKYKLTNARVRQLSVHVAAVRVAARSLSSWLEEDVVGSEEVEDVKSELLEVLSACCSLLSDLQDLVAKALAGAETVGFKGAVTYIWDEDIIKESMETLHYQETALILILQTLGQLTKKEQRAKLQQETVVQTIARAKRPSSSIFGIRGDDRSSVRFSYTSETTERVSAIFTFDMEVMASTAYRNAFTALLKRNIPSKEGDRTSAITLTNVDPSPDTETSITDGIGIAVSTEHTQAAGGDSSMLTEKLSAIQSAQPSVRVTVPTFDKGMFCRALWDYDGSDERSALTFKQGDIIEVITQLESGWYDGILRDVRGWFPSNYCEMVQPGEEQEQDDEDYSSSEDEDEHEVVEKRGSLNESDFWIPQATPDGRLFYFNTLTGVSTMELPLDVP